MSESFEQRAIITGVGLSAVGRPLNRDTLSLTVDACLNAIEDAGLTPADIDGLTTYPGAGYPLEYSPLVAEMQEALRLELNWFRSSSEGPAPLQAVHNAVMAVATGAAKHVLVYLGTTESTAQGGGRRKAKALGGMTRLAGTHPWSLPFGAVSGANWMAPMAQRHFHEFGTKREHLGALAVVQRENAVINPDAVFRKPLTLDDYLGARMISDPLCLFDCDIPCDGAVAFVVSPREHAAACPSTPIAFEAIGTAQHGRASWDQWADLTTMAAVDAAAQMWSRTELTPADVDTAHLYDGFSILTLVWLEALGFCGKGEAGSFIADGARIRRDGDLPVNTDGGQLSAGRLHGFGHLLEACRQLRGDAGERQVEKQPEVAVVGIGAGYLCGSMLLTPLR